MEESETLSIRICERNDAPALAALGVRTFSETFSDVNTPENMRSFLESAYSIEKIENELKEQGAVFFIAEYNGDPVGYARIRTSKKEKGVSGSSPMEIERLYAIKEQLGKGVGRQLMQTCFDYAKKTGCDNVWLGVWEHNTRAIAFYEKWGFKKFGQHVFMLGDDAQTDLLMQKEI
jgi:ribosomal protein S18 acetylase RimI-like enzyme